MIQLSNPDPIIQQLRDIYETLEPEVFYKNHWELAKITEYSALQWKEFLMLPAVSEYIDQELAILIETEKRAILKDISKNQRSVGTSQMLNAVEKILQSGNTKTGPIFVYTYVPLNANEVHAPNVQIAPVDPFVIEEE